MAIERQAIRSLSTRLLADDAGGSTLDKVRRRLMAD